MITEETHDYTSDVDFAPEVKQVMDVMERVSDLILLLTLSKTTNMS